MDWGQVTRLSRRNFLLGALASTAGILAACGGGDDSTSEVSTSSSDSSSTSPASTAVQSTTASGPAGQATPGGGTAVASATNTGETLPGATLKIRSVGEIQNLIPLSSTGRPDSMIDTMIYSKLLFTYPAHPQDLVPDLAEKWEVSNDGLELTFHIRQGAKWHKDYGDVTADDVIWSINRILDPSLATITGPSFANLKDIKATDDHTVVMQLGEPEPLFMYTALVPSSYIINQKAIQDKGDAYSSDPVGSGPYVFTKWIRGQECVLTKNPDHWLNVGNVDEAHFPFLLDDTVAELALRTGELDMSYFETTDTQRAVLDNKDLTVINEPAARVHQVYFSMKEGAPTTDIRVRRALAISLDRKLIAEQAMEGMATPANTMFNPKMPGYLDTEFFPYDPDKAKQLLADAGYADGLSFEAITYTTPPSPDILQIVAAQWEAIGIKVKVNVLENALCFDRWKKRDFEVLMLPLGRPLPEEAIDQYYTSTGIPYPNSAGYKGIDDLAAKMDAEPDVSKRIDIYHQIQQKLVDDVVSIPVVYPNVVLGMRKGIEPFEIGIFWYPLWLVKVTDTK